MRKVISAGWNNDTRRYERKMSDGGVGIVHCVECGTSNISDFPDWARADTSLDVRTVCLACEAVRSEDNGE